MKQVKKVFFIALMIWIIYGVNSFATTGTITVEGARIRKEANTSADVVNVAYEGETVEIIEKSGEWYKVKYENSEGYIREDLMAVSGETEEKNNNEQEKINEAEASKEEEKQEETAQENVEEKKNIKSIEEKQIKKDIVRQNSSKPRPSFSSFICFDTLSRDIQCHILHLVIIIIKIRCRLWLIIYLTTVITGSNINTRRRSCVTYYR